MYRDLEKDFDSFIKNFEDLPAENVIDELEELGVTFVQVGDVKLNYEEENDAIKLQAKETDIL